MRGLHPRADVATRTSTRVIAHALSLTCVDASGALATVDAVLGYDPAEPFAVTASVPTSAGLEVWIFARELLSSGLTHPVGEGDVHIWPSRDTHDHATVIIEHCNRAGELVAQARAHDIDDFIILSLALVPAGTERDHLNLDDVIDRLLQPEHS